MPKIKVGKNKKKFTRTEFNRIAACQLYYNDFQYVKAAYRFAKYGHQGVKRLDKTRYFDHPKAVALIIMLELGVYLPEPIIVALMHDLGEDSHILTWWDIEHFFGKDIYRGLRIITKEEGKDYYEELGRVEKKDWWIQLVKLADILHNMRSMERTSMKFRRVQLEKKSKVYLPLLESMSKKIPRDRLSIVEYLRKEIEHALELVRKSLEPRVN